MKTKIIRFTTTRKDKEMQCKNLIMFGLIGIALCAAGSGENEKPQKKGALCDEAFKVEDRIVISVGDRHYMLRAMLSDVKTMIVNRVNYLKANPGKSTPLDDYLQYKIMNGGIGSQGLSDDDIKPMAILATRVFVNTRLLLVRAAQLGIQPKTQSDGGKRTLLFSPSSGYSREVFDRDTLKAGILTGTSLVLSEDDAFLAEEAMRLEAIPKDYAGGDENYEANLALRYLLKLREGIMVDPPDHISSAELALARKSRDVNMPTRAKGVGNVKPKLKSKLVRIPAGMNSGNDANGLPYSNTMKQDVEMDATEVTFEDWEAVKTWSEGEGYEIIGGGSSGGDNCPVVEMSWYDCMKWCNARSELEGFSPCYISKGKPYRSGICIPETDDAATGYRLPTASEWQYAARGGKIGLRFPWGDTISHDEANYRGSKGSVGDYDLSDGPHPDHMDGAFGKASPVASFKPNGFGLYDMAGNVWEYVGDVYPVDKETAFMCGGCFGQSGHFAQIHRKEPTPRGSGRMDVGFRTLRLAAKAKSETTITVDQGLVEKMAAAIKDSLQQPKSKMENFARNMATFPSWKKSLKGEAYSVGDYVCIWQKSPPLDIDADSHRWQAGLGEEKYSARISELRTSNLSYLHSLAIYDPAWHEGTVPIPCIVITVELSSSTGIPYVCAFTPDGHKNFGKYESLSDDAGMLLNALAAVSLAFDTVPERIGDAEKGFSLLKRMKDKPKGNKAMCANCSGSGLVGGSVCSRCKGWGKVSGIGAGKCAEGGLSL